MNEHAVDVVIDAQVPANSISAHVDEGGVTLTVSLQVDPAALTILAEPIAKAVREQVDAQRRKSGGPGLLMMGIV